MDLGDHNAWRTPLLPCEESHDGFHHFPLNIDTGIERKDCIECGLFKEQIIYRLLSKGKRRRSGPPPPPGKFPKIKDPDFPKPTPS